MSAAKTFALLSASAIYTLFCSQISVAIDTITTTLSIRDGETIVSAKEHFELGFFSPGKSTHRYLGIWYKRIQPITVVWVANRNNPITDLTGVVNIGNNGGLSLLTNQSSSVIWSTNVSKVDNPIARLLDTGNLAISEQGQDEPKDYLWQSFDYPTDTMLPEMKFGYNFKTGLDRYFTSWRNADDPSTGEYSFMVDLHGLPQAFVFHADSPVTRIGYWNGEQIGGFELLNRSRSYFNFWKFVSNQDEFYYSFTMTNETTYTRLVTELTGIVQRYNWLEESQEWIAYWKFPDDQCDPFMKCGAYGYCVVIATPICSCLKGFKPKNSLSWSLNDWSDGCIRKTEFQCQKNDGFLKVERMKIPDTSGSFYDKNMNLMECEAECRKNCSCKAYSNLYVTNGGTGCIIWVDGLIDIVQFDQGGYDLYLRMAASEIDDGGSTYSKRKTLVALVVIFTVIPLSLLLTVCLIWKRKKIMKIIWKRATKARGEVVTRRGYTVEKKDDCELTLFDLVTITTATYNFSEVNILGKGGFGCVYKGTLGDGQQIAVKRLSMSSGQGVEEFKTEVMLIANLQHRNLVRLLGSCIEGEERMLVYEYMQNNSLDSFLFKNSMSLDWELRCSIIAGIARGLLYLHQDSRFRIIHRDLKISNILLDGEMNPKISDFGIARIIGANQTEGKTRRVVGTYGYMSPEYAMAGLFSTKSDVFSFGVLVLEIVSGKKNNALFGSDSQDNLLGYAWTLWTEGRGLELMDESMRGLCPSSEVLKCIQVGLLCVQEHAKDRPTMSYVITTLVSETATLPQPKKPGFVLVSDLPETELPSSKHDTVNQITVTALAAR